MGTAEGFFKSYLALPVVIAFFVIGAIWKGGVWMNVKDIDVDTGRRPVDWEVINAERTRIANLPAFRRILKVLF